MYAFVKYSKYKKISHELKTTSEPWKFPWYGFSLTEWTPKRIYARPQ